MRGFSLDVFDIKILGDDDTTDTDLEPNFPEPLK